MQKEKEFQKPLISVILPMHEHRGIALEALESWIDQQRCQADDYEIILIIDDTLQDFEPMFRQKLRPHDTLLPASNENYMEHYNLGAGHARGEVLFFTEPHCMAEPQAVAEMIQYMTTHAPDGFCARTVPICPTPLARLASRMFEEFFVEWSRPDHWSKVFLRGFGLRRSIYFAVGGFQSQYFRFAESLLAVTLRNNGYQIGYAPGVGIRHLYEDTFALLDSSLKFYTEGECLYWLHHPSGSLNGFFDVPPEWNDISSIHTYLKPTLRHVLWRQLRIRAGITATFRGWILSVGQFVNILLSGKLTQTWLLLKSSLLVWLTKSRYFYCWFHTNRRFQVFRKYCTEITSHYRLIFGLKHFSQSSFNQIPQSEYFPEQMDSHQIVGFYPIESYQGKRFRWSSPISAVRVNLDPASYALTIHLQRVRHLVPEKELSIFWGQTRIQSVTFDPEKYTLHCIISKNILETSEEDWLIFLCIPWNIPGVHRKDKRKLGIPVVSIHFDQQNSTTSG